MTATPLSSDARKTWVILFSVVLGTSLQLSCQKSASSSAGAGGGVGGTTTAEEEVELEVSGTIDPTDFVQAQDSVEIGGVNLTTAGTYAISAFYISPLGEKFSVYQGSTDSERFSFKSKVPKRYLTIDVTRLSDGYRLGAFLPPALRNKLAKLRLNRTSSIAAKMATIVADKAAAGDEAALKALSTNSISVADTLILAQSVARVITEQAAQNKGSSIDLAAIAAKLVEKSNEKITALQVEGQSVSVVAEKISEKTYETVFSGDAEATSPGVLAYRTNHDLGSSDAAKRDLAYESIIAVSSVTTKFIDEAFRVEAGLMRNAESLSAAVAAQVSVATAYSEKFNACANGQSSCAPAGYTPPSPPSSSSSTGGSGGASNTCSENGWCAGSMTYYIGGAATSLDTAGSGIWNNQSYTAGSLKSVITITSHPANQTASSGSVAFSVTAVVTNNANLSYQWQKQENGSGDFNAVSGATSATLNLSSLTNADDNNDVYRVVVSATGGATSVTTSSATLTVPAVAPAVPTAVSGTAGNTQVSLTWTAPTSNGGSAITDYIVQHSSNSGSSWTTFDDGTSTSASATVTGLTNGTAYTFQVAAVNSAGTGSYSSSSSPVTPIAPTPVITITSQPGNQTASGGSATFSATATVTQSATLSYQWQKQESNGSSFSNISGATSATLSRSSLTNANDNGDLYRVVVSATGGATSVTSSQATLTVNPCAPNGWCVEEMTYYIQGTATSLDITGGGTWNGQTYTGGTLKAVITITSHPANQTASSGSATFSVTATATNSANLSYQWQKQEGGSGAFNNVGTDSATLSLSGLTNADDNNDVYRVVVSATGGATSVTTSSATLTVPAGAPGVPTAVSGTAGNTQVSLTWTAPASDGGAAITDYVVQYTINGGSSWTTFADGTSTSTSATVTGLTNGTAYVFRIATVNFVGQGSYSSSSSPVTPIAPTPVITINTQPSNQTASSGSASFSVSVSVTESASLSYQWQKQESGDGYFSDVSGATSATLNLSSLTLAADNGDAYRVVVSATGGATSVTSNTATLTVAASGATACSGDCYIGAQDLAIGTERQGPGSTTLTLQYAAGSSGFKIWKEKGATRILNSTGLIANGWQKELTSAGTGFSGTDFTNGANIAGRVCPTHVFLSHSNMTAENRCLYYDAGNIAQSLNAVCPLYDDGDGWFFNECTSPLVANEVSDWLQSWDRAATGRGSSSSYFEGNIKTCADKGMRLPTMYESTMAKPDSNLPSGDSISPTWAGSTNGVPRVGTSWTWTASANHPNPVLYWAWGGWSVTSYASASYDGSASVRCVLPSSDGGG